MQVRLLFMVPLCTCIIYIQGRLHVYEGHPLWRVTMPVRILRMVGVTHLIVTNAVGGLNPDYKVG